MVDKSAKKRAKVEFIEGLEKLCKQIDEDYQEIIKSKGSLEEILGKIEEYTFNHEIQWKKLEDELYVPYKLTEIDICKARQQVILSKSSLGLTSISLSLSRIKNGTCYTCKNQLTKDNCYLYFFKNKSIIKWTLEEALNFNSEQFYTLFCSPTCFQNSIYYPKQSKTSGNSREREREREQKPNQTLLKILSPAPNA